MKGEINVTEKAVIMDENQIKRAVARISYEIAERNKGTDNLEIVGIMSRGVFIAERIAEKLRELEGFHGKTGIIDITSTRDDEKMIPDSDKTDIPFGVTGKTVILVDDVMFTGRSCRAAIDALMKRGRPQKIELAVLVDRGHRELPLRPDYVGKNVPTSRDESVRVMMSETDGCDKAVILQKEELVHE